MSDGSQCLAASAELKSVSLYVCGRLNVFGPGEMPAHARLEVVLMSGATALVA